MNEQLVTLVTSVLTKAADELLELKPSEMQESEFNTIISMVFFKIARDKFINISK